MQYYLQALPLMKIKMIGYLYKKAKFRSIFIAFLRETNDIHSDWLVYEYK